MAETCGREHTGKHTYGRTWSVDFRHRPTRSGAVRPGLTLNSALNLRRRWLRFVRHDGCQTWRERVGSAPCFTPLSPPPDALPHWSLLRRAPIRTVFMFCGVSITTAPSTAPIATSHHLGIEVAQGYFLSASRREHRLRFRTGVAARV